MPDLREQLTSILEAAWDDGDYWCAQDEGHYAAKDAQGNIIEPLDKNASVAKHLTEIMELIEP